MSLQKTTLNDQPITKLSNTVQGDYKFGMDIPDIMISDAIKKSTGYNYYIAKKKESAKEKTSAETANSIQYSRITASHRVSTWRQLTINRKPKCMTLLVDSYARVRTETPPLPCKRHVVKDLVVQSILDL
ncbi:hypothetical protein Tco_0889730 [Tanacetum coccineum]